MDRRGVCLHPRKIRMVHPKTSKMNCECEKDGSLGCEERGRNGRNLSTLPTQFKYLDDTLYTSNNNRRGYLPKSKNQTMFGIHGTSCTLECVVHNRNVDTTRHVSRWKHMILSWFKPAHYHKKTRPDTSHKWNRWDTYYSRYMYK
jgi:hypothetical protein